MAITVNIRHVEDRSLVLKGEQDGEELGVNAFDEMIRAAEPLKYDLTVDEMGSGLLVQGTLELRIECECVRCLKKFHRTIQLEHWACDVPLSGEDAVPIDNDVVDLTPLVREDILLAFPQHPLCETECRGLPSAPHSGSISGASQSEGSSAWAELNKLKF